MCFTDANGVPYQVGTVVDLMPYSPHAGIIGYNAAGDQVVAHNSKKDGRAVVSSPEGFNDGHIPVRPIDLPLTTEDGERRWQNAVRDVRRGVRWLPLDNCRDFVSRAVTGSDGSPTRDAVLLLGGLFALLKMFSS